MDLYYDLNDDLNHMIEDNIEDNVIELMYLQYIYTFIYIEQVKTIQKYYRNYILKKRIKLVKHLLSMQRCLEDIIEFSYLPPDNNYPLLKNGGFHYREGLKSFNECLRKYFN